MRSHRWLLAASVALLSAVVFGACGGSSGNGGSLASIPTATLPNPLPQPVIVGSVSPEAGGTKYTVQSGDNLSSIADQFGTTVDAIVEANDIADPTALEVGQVLTIPGTAPGQNQVLSSTAVPAATPTAPSEARATPTAALEGNTYIVRAGDIPETIAAQFGITADALMAANGITDPTSLQIGQRLIIPTPVPAATPAP